MSFICVCDNCGRQVEENPQMIYSLHHGAVIIDIKVGVHRSTEGTICYQCTKDLLALIAENGIFTHRKITLPETIKPVIEAKVEKKIWTLTH